MGKLRWSLGTNELTEVTNRSKEVYVETMLKEGVINKTQANKMLKYSIVHSQKKFFGSLLGKLIWRNADSEKTESICSIVKIVSIPEKENVLPE